MNVVEKKMKKNPCGKFIGISQKKIVINMYKDMKKQEAEDPDSPQLSYKEMLLEISNRCGIGQRTVQTTLSEYKHKGTVSSPNKNKIRSTIIEKLDDFDKNSIRQIVHNFWFDRQIPTLPKILTAVNEDETLPTFKRSTFHKVLKDLNFVNVNKSQNGAILEREDIVTWRQRYLDLIQYYRQTNKPIYFLDETWIDIDETSSRTSVNQTDNSMHEAFFRGLSTGQKKPSGKGTRLIVLHIGSMEGFVPGGLLCFESKTDSTKTNHHNVMDDDTFYKWFIKILPLLKENAVIVMDSASYHSAKKDRIPVMTWPKQDIINWLENRGEIINKPMVKVQLLEKVKLLRPLYDKYVIDEYARENQKIVLRLPPNHCELNPIELAWSSVKHFVRTNNSTFKLKDVQELLIRGVEIVTPKMWTHFIEQAVNEEDKFREIDFITDELMDKESE